MIICEHDEDQRYQFHDGAKNSTAGRMTFYDHDHSEAGAEESCGKLYDAHRTSVQSRNRVSIMS